MGVGLGVIFWAENLIGKYNPNEEVRLERHVEDKIVHVLDGGEVPDATTFV